MTSFGYRLNPRYAIKECLSCGALYTGDFCCSKRNVEDKILVPKLPKNCARSGYIFPNFQNTSESFDDSANVVNAPLDPFVVKKDHGVNPPHIDECCYECGDALGGIFRQQYTISSGSTTTHSDISLLDYEFFYFDDDHIEESSGGSTTTHFDISLFEYDSFIFDLSNDQFPSSDRSDFTHEEFVDKLAHIISPPEYDCFYFRDLLDSGELISIFNSGIRKNLSTTCVNLPIEDDHSPLLAYVVWIFLAYLTYPVIPPYLHPFGNEDTIFNPGITINRVYSFKPGLSHRCRAFKKFNTHRSHLNEWPMIINGKNTPILDVLLFHFYPP
nr:hypothetical protein [Tanacetum cinerariifolium]